MDKQSRRSPGRRTWCWLLTLALSSALVLGVGVEDLGVDLQLDGLGLGTGTAHAAKRKRKKARKRKRKRSRKRKRRARRRRGRKGKGKKTAAYKPEPIQPLARPDYTRAHQLLLRGQAMMQLGNDSSGMTLLRYALAAQMRGGKREVGYARFIHFLFARRAFKRGDKKGAKRELLRAFAIKEDQQFVVKRYRVTPRHPFVLNNFPKIAGISIKRVQGNSLFPEAINVVYVGGKYIYGVGTRAVYRLDRKRQTVLPLHKADQPITQVSVHPSHKRMVVIYSKLPRLHYLGLDPVEEANIALPAVPKAAYISANGRTATVYASDKDGDHLVVYRVYLHSSDIPAGKKRVDRVLHVRARALFRSASRLVYASYIKGTERSSVGHPVYRKVVLSRLDGKRGQKLFVFERPARQSDVYAVPSRDRKRVAIFVRDTARNKRLAVLINDLAVGKRLLFPYKAALVWPKRRPAVWSNGGRFLLLLAKRKGNIDILRLSSRNGALGRVGQMPPGSGVVHDIGLLAGDGRFYVLRPRTLTVARMDGRHASTLLDNITGIQQGRYRGRALRLVDPEVLYVGYRRRRTQTFVRVPTKKLRMP